LNESIGVSGGVVSPTTGVFSPFLFETEAAARSDAEWYARALAEQHSREVDVEILPARANYAAKIVDEDGNHKRFVRVFGANALAAEQEVKASMESDEKIAALVMTPTRYTWALIDPERVAAEERELAELEAEEEREVRKRDLDRGPLAVVVQRLRAFLLTLGPLVAAIVFVLFSYSEGDRVTPDRWRPVDWVSSVWGYCGDFQYQPETEKGSGEDTYFISQAQAVREMRENNRKVDRCNARARREGRNYSPEWANFVATLLLFPIAFGAFSWWRWARRA
jgi:hypothetical protein